MANKWKLVNPFGHRRREEEEIPALVRLGSSGASQYRFLKPAPSNIGTRNEKP